MTIEVAAPAPPRDAAPAAALKVEDLSLSYTVRGIPRPVLRGVSFEVRAGESYGLVGESGCGKSTTAYAAVHYLPRNAVITGGRILVDGDDITKMSDERVRTFRIHHASMVYQDPGAALNPSTRIGPQVAEAFTVLGQNGKQAQESALQALRRVQIADPEGVAQRYPHQLSGGMQQRVVIAMALASNPKLLILDEPTTGLDATVEASVLDLVRSLQAEMDAAVLLIAHNLGVIRTMCDRVGVMYAGKIVEEGDAAAVFEHPEHPYTLGLLRSLPRRGVRKTERALSTIPGNLPQIGTNLPTCVFVDRCPLADELCRNVEPPIVPVGNGRWTRCHHRDRIGELTEAPPIVGADTVHGEPTLILEGVSKTFHQGGHDVPALVKVDLELLDGETLGLVGESGSGKSTLAKTILGIEAPDTGARIELDEHALAPLATRRPTDDKRSIQMVFQNPDFALNRGWTARRILARSVSKLTGLKGKAVDERVDKLASDLRLTQRHLDLKPRQLSGGLKQRLAIARAFAGDPEIVVADEPTSALDVSVQAAILNLLSELQAKSRTSYLLISHDLGVVRYLADRIAVMYLGRIMEVGDSETVFRGPNHPYTEALLSAVPNVDGTQGARILLEGEIPSPADPPSGCVFNTRCHRMIPGLCEVVEPPLAEVEPGHLMSCHIPLEELRRLQSKAVELAEEGVTLTSVAPTLEAEADGAVVGASAADTGAPAGTVGMAMPAKLILDVDTGTDDAVALMLAALHPDLELVAATTVNGNNPVAYCTDNTLRVFDLLDVDVPVYEGMATPLVRDDFPIPRAELHSRGTIHGLELPIPKPRSVNQTRHAAEFLIETYLAATEPIALVPVGPLTNVAMAIKLEPRIVERIPRTVIMGGAHQVGNTTAAAEFNVWVDPEAARIVFRAGLRDLVLVPLDATHRALVSSDDCRRLEDLGTPAGRAAAAIIGERIAAYDKLQPMAVVNSAPVHDALCVAYLVDLTVVTGRRLHVDVETSGELTMGRTVMDTRNLLGKEPNAYVAFDADAPKFVAMLLETFARN